MIDCGHNATTGFRPSEFIQRVLKQSHVDYLLITNVDQDHISDLSNFVKSGMGIKQLISNTKVDPNILRLIKLQGGALTNDAEAYLRLRTSYGPPGSGYPFDSGMGGIVVRSFSHNFPDFSDTNNLSCVYFISFADFTILFPGDLERDGWLAHLKNPEFVELLQRTNILVASHHGRR